MPIAACIQLSLPQAAAQEAELPGFDGVATTIMAALDICHLQLPLHWPHPQGLTVQPSVLQPGQRILGFMLLPGALLHGHQLHHLPENTQPANVEWPQETAADMECYMPAALQPAGIAGQWLGACSRKTGNS